MKVKLMSKIFIPFICAIFFASAIHAQDKCDNIYSEPSIGVTFCAPQKWTIIKEKSAPHAKIFGPRNDGVTVNINVQTESFIGSLSEYTDVGVEYFLKIKGEYGLSKLEVKSKSEFAADKKGFKIVYDAEVKGVNLRVIQYSFKGLGDIKIVVTAFLSSLDADALEKVVDASIKTFKITAVKPIGIKTRKISSGS